VTTHERVWLSGGMELGQAFRRIVLRHAALILTAVLLTSTGVYLLHRHDVPLYSASARLVLDTGDPRQGSESVAIADTVRAIATGQTHVSDAMKSLGIDRDPVDLATRKIKVDALGTSGVVSLTVTDRDARVAAALANYLADDVVATRRSLDQAAADEQSAELARRIDAVNAGLADVDARYQQLPQSGYWLAGQRASLASEKVALEQELASVRGASAGRPVAAVLDRAASPAHADTPRTLIDVTIALLAGLVLGLLLASLLEALSPRLVGEEGVARAFAVPVVGRYRRPAPGRAQVHRLLSDLRMLGIQAGVDHVRLLPVGQVDASGLLGYLKAAAKRKPAGIHISTFDSSLWATDPTRLNGELTKSGVVLVTAPEAEERALVRAADTVQMSRWPVLGLITAEAKGG